MVDVGLFMGFVGYKKNIEYPQTPFKIHCQIVVFYCKSVDWNRFCLTFHPPYTHTHTYTHAAMSVAARRHRSAHWVRSNGRRVALRQDTREDALRERQIKGREGRRESEEDDG